MTGATVVYGHLQDPESDLRVIHQAAGILRELSGVAVEDALGWLDDAARSANLTASDVARRIIRTLERRHAELWG